ncbi:ATP-dependent DNA helicase PIF1-like protein [Tanacetum coccineum]
MVGSIGEVEKGFHCILYAKIIKIHREHGWAYLACKKFGNIAKQTGAEGINWWKCKSSSIASLLLDGGRTAHSWFAIPITVVEDSMCTIAADSDLADLIRETKLIIWDEALMTIDLLLKLLIER